MAVKAKELRFAIDLGDEGVVRTEDGTPLAAPAAWSPEHLLLAALSRCSLQSLRYSARRDGIEVAAAKGSARALVTRRESDGRYAIVESEVSLDVTLEPRPGERALAELLENAERGCFIGASLAAKPAYRWNVA
ncbi:MAG: OsmC family protein [Gaiellaceae bacterium]